MPDVPRMLAAARAPVKLSCVLTPTNDSPAAVRRYIAAARGLGVTRIAFRHVHDAAAPRACPPPRPLFGGLVPARMHAGNPVYDLHGVEVTHWCFEGTTGDSLNLFADGSLSSEYLLTRATAARAGALR